MAQNDIYLVRQKADGTFEEIANSPFQYDAASASDVPNRDNNTFHINTKLRVDELEVNGQTTVIDQDTTTSEQLLVTNDGTGPAAVINQLGNEGIIDIQDDGHSSVFVRGDSSFAGFVGLNNNLPTERLHVIAGNILIDNANKYMAEDSNGIKIGMLGMLGDVVQLTNGAAGGLSVSTSGNVGIGTTNPTARLVVKESNTSPAHLGRFTNDSGQAIVTIRAKSDNLSILEFADADDANVGAINYSHASNYMRLKTADVERLSIDSSGRVGIGTMSPDFLLDLVQKDGGVQLQMGRSNTGVGSAWMGADSTGFHLGVGAYAGAGGDASNPNGFSVDTSGNVGIGTTSPDYKLHITGGTPAVKLEGTQPRIWLSETDQTDLNTLIRNHGSLFQIDTASDQDSFVANRLTINHTSGNVGIGTDSPSTKLEVNGSTKIKGGLYLDSVDGFISLTQKHAGAELFDYLHSETGAIEISSVNPGPSGTTLANITKAQAYTETFIIPAYPTTTDNEPTKKGVRYYIKLRHQDAEAGIRFAINDSPDFSLSYGYAPGSMTDNSYVWSTFDITDHMQASNTLYFWGSTLDGGVVYDRYVFASSGIALPNEPVEQNQVFAQGLTSYGNVGIGTTSPSAKLEVKSGVNAFPVSDISADQATSLRVAGDDNAVIDMGSNGGGGTWIQARNKTADNTQYNLSLNPLGGNVGIGINTPTCALDISREDNEIAEVRIRGGSQGSGTLFVGQSEVVGGGIMYNGDDIPDQTISPSAGFPDRTTLFRRNNGDDSAVMQWGHDSSDITFYDGLFIPDNIYHSADSNTYFGFHNPDQWRVVTGGTQRLEVTNTKISLDRDTDVEGDLTISGDLTVNGDTVTLNTTNLEVEDKLIKVAKNATNATTANGCGLDFGGQYKLTFEEESTNKLVIEDTADNTASLEIQGFGSAQLILQDTNSSNTTNQSGTIDWKLGNDTVTAAVGFINNGDSNFSIRNASGDIVLDTSDNVGIGTTSPSQKLEVAGHIFVNNGQGIFKRNSTSGPLYVEQQGSGPAGVFVGGNVGIGTITPESPLTISLDPNGDDTIKMIDPRAYVEGESRSGISFQGNDSADTRTAFGSIRAYGASGNRGGLRFSSRPTSGGTAVAMVLNEDGNVGIGTTNPGSSLHVAGEMGISPLNDGVHMGVRATGGNRAIIQLNGAGGGYIDFSESGTDWKGRILYDNADNYMRFDTNQTQRMRIDSAGNVGIGTTSPESRLQIPQPGTTIGGNDLTKGCILLGNSAEGVAIDNNEIIKKGPGATSDFVIGNANSAGDILLRTNQADRVVISNDSTTVNNVLQAHGGMTIATNEDNNTPELTLKRTSSTNASGNDDIVDLRVADGGLNFIINNDADGEQGTYQFQKMAGGLTVPAAINCDTITTNGIIRKNGDTNTYLEFHSADRLRLVTGGVQQLEVTNSGLFIQDFIKHTGDDNTYFGFHNPDQWRVVTGGTQRLEVTNTKISLDRDTDVNGDLDVTGSITVNGQPIGGGSSNFSGDYNDLTNKPAAAAIFVVNTSPTTAIPSLTSGITAAQVRSLIGAGTGSSNFSGDYNELTNKPAFVGTGTGVQTMLGTLEVQGGAGGESIRAAGDIVALATMTSDDALKTNKVTIDGALDKVCSLNGFTFDWNEKAAEIGIQEEGSIGLSAQEIEKVVPEVVKPLSNTEYKYVNYEKLVPVLVEAIKELKSEIEQLKSNQCDC